MMRDDFVPSIASPHHRTMPAKKGTYTHRHILVRGHRACSNNFEVEEYVRVLHSTRALQDFWDDVVGVSGALRQWKWKASAP